MTYISTTRWNHNTLDTPCKIKHIIRIDFRVFFFFNAPNRTFKLPLWLTHSTGQHYSKTTDFSCYMLLVTTGTSNKFIIKQITG